MSIELKSQYPDGDWLTLDHYSSVTSDKLKEFTDKAEEVANTNGLPTNFKVVIRLV